MPSILTALDFYIVLPLLPEVGHGLADLPAPPTRPSLDPEQEKRRRFEMLAHFLSSQVDTRTPSARGGGPALERRYQPGIPPLPGTTLRCLSAPPPANLPQ